MAYNLPTNFALDDPNHVAAHNSTNAAVNDLDSRVTSATSVANTALQPNYISAGTGITKSGTGTAESPLTFSTTNGASLRRDTTVGERVIATVNGIDTMLYGDTGWRNVGSLLVNGWTGDVLLRRVSNQVFCRLHNIDPTAKTSSVFITLPDGFRANRWMYVYVGEWMLYTDNGDTLKFDGTPPSDAQWVNGFLYISWLTTNAWPTTLPGTPA